MLSLNNLVKGAKITDPANSAVLFRNDECGRRPFTWPLWGKNTYIDKVLKFLAKPLVMYHGDWIMTSMDRLGVFVYVDVKFL